MKVMVTRELAGARFPRDHQFLDIEYKLGEASCPAGFVLYSKAYRVLGKWSYLIVCLCQTTLVRPDDFSYQLPCLILGF
jgi:hypothetical protein